MAEPVEGTTVVAEPAASGATPALDIDELVGQIEDRIVGRLSPAFDDVAARVVALEGIRPQLEEVVGSTRELNQLWARFAKNGGTLNEQDAAEVAEAIKLKQAEERATKAEGLADAAVKAVPSAEKREEQRALDYYNGLIPDMAEYFEERGLPWATFKNRIIYNPDNPAYVLGTFRASDRIDGINQWKAAGRKWARDESNRQHQEEQEKLNLPDARSGGGTGSREQDLVNRLALREALTPSEMVEARAAWTKGFTPKIKR